MAKMSKTNGSKPKVEFLEESLALAQEIASAYDLTLDQAIALLVFTEMKCVHSHFDKGVVVQQTRSAPK